MRAKSYFQPIAGILAIAFFHGPATGASLSEPVSPAAANAFEHRTLWYNRPAQGWASEALPIGNGRMGAMLFGGVNVERIQFNENSLWSGDNNWDGGYDTGDHGFGSYRNFGDLRVEWGKDAEAVPADYRRALDISTGIHRTTFSQNGAAFTREAFASRPDQVMVFHYTRDQERREMWRALRPAGAHARPARREDRGR